MLLAEKLRNSTNVKRELQLNEYENQQPGKGKGGGDDIFASYWDEEEEEEQEEQVVQPKVELKENLQIHVVKSMEYYSFVNIPLLGLVFYIEHKEGLESDNSNLYFF